MSVSSCSAAAGRLRSPGDAVAPSALVLPGPVVGFAGSRSLPESALPVVAACVRAALRAGRGVAAGCAVGADAAALRAAVRFGGASRLSVFCAFGPLGVGSWRSSAVSAVAAAGSRGASVRWWAGGPASAPLLSRLSARTLAFVSFLASRPGSSLVCFVSSRASRGTLLGACAAARRGVPVFFFPVGFPGGLLPPLGPGGSWVPCRLAGQSGFFRWQWGRRAAWLSPAEEAALGLRFRRLPPGRPASFCPPELAVPPVWE